jgi:hypothetical protein
MISQFERFAFLGEFRVYTFRNYFQNSVPTMSALVTEMQANIATKKTYILTAGAKTLTLWDLHVSKSGYAEFLFRLTDPEIPDNELADRGNGALRTAARKSQEDPAVSAHVVIDMRTKHDTARSYPTCIENMSHLPRSLIERFFNEWFTKEFGISKPWGKKRELKPLRPRLEFIAPASQTISDVLSNGGVLKGVTWVEDEILKSPFADKAYPLETRRDVAVNVKNRPTGIVAKTYLDELWKKARGRKTSKMKIRIEDSNNRSKTINADLNKNNILSNFFIAQELLSNFSPPLAMCEKNIRKDMVAKMQSALPK